MKCRVFGLSLLVVLLAVPSLADVTWWSVPAMSGVQRLPDAIPADGEQRGTVRIVAARGEYEPGSFVVRPRVDLGKVQPVVGKLVNEKGDVFPAYLLRRQVLGETGASASTNCSEKRGSSCLDQSSSASSTL